MKQFDQDRLSAREQADLTQINQFQTQAESWIASQKPDGLEVLMPLEIFRVTWTEDGENREAWFRTEDEAGRKKFEIDFSQGKCRYLNFERWFAYRDAEHDQLYGRIPRDGKWFDTGRS